MTSTKFNVGLGENTRNSSRVLRPPGGGHTNIFAHTVEGAQPPKRDHGRNTSSILEGTNTHQPQPTEATTAKASEPTPVPQTNVESSVPQSKGRVPPGGFSSGLW